MNADGDNGYNTTLLSNHGGGVLGSTTTYAIFTGPRWNTNSGFTGDKISSIQSLLAGFGNSQYASILTEYSAAGVTVTPQSTFAATIVDNATNFDNDPGTQALANYVCTQVTNNNITVSANAVFIDYVETLPPEIIEDGQVVGFVLGYHGQAPTSCGSLKVAIIFNADEFVLASGYGTRSTEAAGLASVSAHELAETITDFDVQTGWFDQVNPHEEIADKCAATTSGAGFSTLSNGDQFNLPGLWSNIAFGQGVGIPEFAGCVIAPPPPPLTVTIVGPSLVAESVSCTWTAQVSGGTPPYNWAQTAWYDVQHDMLDPQQGFGTQAWTARVTTFAASNTEVAVTVSDAAGQTAGGIMFVRNTGWLGAYDHTYCR
ncbi:MAG TPA: hypothetical protein VH559_00045 [Gemmatimonadaceae bacterium]|jgi:hypothetical protein